MAVDQSKLSELKLEAEEQNAFVDFLASASFSRIEKKFKEEVSKLTDLLYNGGKPVSAKQESDKFNGYRAEIRVRKEFLEKFYESRDLLEKINNDIKSMERGEN